MAYPFNYGNYGYGYSQPQPQYYQPQPQPQVQPQVQVQSALPGRIVNNSSEINVNDIPMTGEKAIFVKADGTEIYCKQWQSDGTIKTTSYLPQISTLGEKVDNSIAKDFSKEFDTIFERLDGIEEQLSKIVPTKTQKVKKESEINE